MKTGFTKTITLALLAGTFSHSSADVDVSLSADEQGIKEFHLAIGNHFESSEKEVLIVKERGIPDDDLPVVFFLARNAGVEPGVIIELRLGGKSWMDISLKYGLGAAIYYVEVKGDPGPPYGKAYGHFKKKNRKEWNAIRLVDSDIVNLVNLKFISEHYGYSADEVIKMRSSGDSFAKINGKIKQAKGKAKADKSAKKTVKASKAKVKNK